MSFKLQRIYYCIYLTKQRENVLLSINEDILLSTTEIFSKNKQDPVLYDGANACLSFLAHETTQDVCGNYC